MLAVLAGLCSLTLGCRDSGPPEPPAAPPEARLERAQLAGLGSAVASRTPAPVPRPCQDLPRLGPTVMRGVSYVHSYQAGGARGYGSQTSQRSLAELDGVGVNAVSLMPFGFMSSLSAQTIARMPEGGAGESDSRVARELARARKHGFAVMMKPHIWVRGGAYRGGIDPGSEAGWDRWFEAYRAFLLHYADMAAKHRVPLLSIGVELKRAVAKHPARFRALIGAVRARYHGKLVYSANWDEVQDVSFWDALDYIGVQFFPPIADRAEVDEAVLQGAVAGHLDGLGEVSRRVGKPVLLTEVGYKSVVGTAMAPHEWPERMGGDPAVSEAAQLSAYRALLRELSGRSFVAGLFVWKWFTDPDSREEGPAGFSPRGKLAEAALRCAFAR